MRLVRSPRFWIGIAISVIALWLAVRDVPLEEFSTALRQASYGWLIPAVIIQYFAILGRAQRWRVLLDNKATLRSAFWAHSIGFLFTNVFPLRMGEPARIAVMSERNQIPVVQVAASAMVERLLDVAIVVLGLVFVLPFMQVPPLAVQAGLTFGGVVIAALVALVFVVRFRGPSERLLQWVLSRLTFLPTKAILLRWGELVEGLTPLTRLGTGLAAVFWTVVSWIFSLLIYVFVLRAFQPDATILEALFMIVVLALAITVPSSPGFIGVYQYIGQQALVIPFGGKYTESNALAITMTTHLIYLLITTGFGIVGLWRIGESFGNIGRMLLSRQAKKEPDPLI
jgi:glycosyltransferase 2 family protein